MSRLPSGRYRFLREAQETARTNKLARAASFPIHACIREKSYLQQAGFEMDAPKFQNIFLRGARFGREDHRRQGGKAQGVGLLVGEVSRQGIVPILPSRSNPESAETGGWEGKAQGVGLLVGEVSRQGIVPILPSRSNPESAETGGWEGKAQGVVDLWGE